MAEKHPQNTYTIHLCKHGNEFQKILDFAAAVRALVIDRKLRAALNPRVRLTLELVLRKLAAGVDADTIISTVANDIHRNERTVRRHLAQSRKAASA
jgi:predicted transcriptional regulator